MYNKEITKEILNSNIFKEWHYFKYHFQFFKNGIFLHPLANSIAILCSDLENKKENLGKSYIKKIESFCGREKFLPHYEQLLQTLSELMVVHKATTYDWSPDYEIIQEPTTNESKKNPEISIQIESIKIGIEVKSPEFFKKALERSSKSQQISTRTQIFETVKKNETMLPRDNTLKDFFQSANEKFLPFKKESEQFIGVLVVVWDDFIYEPISAIAPYARGLFSENSFVKDNKGEIEKFLGVDCVILTRHLLPIVKATRDEAIPDLYRYPLDYGLEGEFPFKVFYNNPWSKQKINPSIYRCFQAIEPGAHLGAEYLPSDFINWI